MAIKWLTTGQLAKLIEDQYPATPNEIRELCEAGDIPSKYAKRPVGKERGHWKIAVRGLRWILERVFGFDEEEIQEVAAKAPVNFKRRHVA